MRRCLCLMSKDILLRTVLRQRHRSTASHRMGVPRLEEAGRKGELTGCLWTLWGQEGAQSMLLFGACLDRAVVPRLGAYRGAALHVGEQPHLLRIARRRAQAGDREDQQQGAR